MMREAASSCLNERKGVKKEKSGASP